MESITNWIFEQGSLVVSYAIGVGSTYIFMNKVNQERIAMMEKSMDYFKSELKLLKEDLRQSDIRCEERVAQSEKRYQDEIELLRELFLGAVKSMKDAPAVNNPPCGL